MKTQVKQLDEINILLYKHLLVFTVIQIFHALGSTVCRFSLHFLYCKYLYKNWYEFPLLLRYMLVSHLYFTSIKILFCD